MRRSAMIKVIIFVYAVLLFTIKNYAQDFDEVDNVSHDIAYYRESMATAPIIKVLYGRPVLEDGKTFEQEVTYDKIWRTGANEATEIRFYNDVVFGDKTIKAGTYVLLSIPGENEWEVILNRKLDVWGAFQYDPSQDIARIKVPVSKAERLDAFSIAFKRIRNEIQLVMGWDTVRVKIPIKIEETVVAKL